MRMSVAIVAGLMMVGQVARAGGDLPVLLQLDRLVDGAVAHSVVLYGTARDPNVSDIEDRFRLEVNGHAVAVPRHLLARLAHDRRGYSYDHFTQGISETRRQALCKMAGPARGDRLSTLYLTYENDRVTGSALRPVLSEAGNCLFAEHLTPNAPEAALAAAKALASLQVILEMQGD